ncbi:bacterial Ig-like domain (group 2) [Clostridium ragsdalei P11]|uniref:Bacterial Ig-like domain (Group 2) n=2 Tax=Clostridium ragsdalei TaxID=217158 RepID=A0A1A6AMI0_9CLOT|nr:bacterial Ig-like domain (group 2) [Clostridium ragsdalei P11]
MMIVSMIGINVGSVFADENSNDINVNAAVVGMYNENLFSPQQIKVKGNATAEDVLKATGLDVEVKDTGMVDSIAGQKNGTDDCNYGSQSGWMYKVNYTTPKNYPKSQSVKDGDYLLFFYAKNYDDLLSSYDSIQNDFVNVTVKNVQKDNSFSEQVTVLNNNSINAAIMEGLKKHGQDFDKSSLAAGALMSKDDTQFWSYTLNGDNSTYNQKDTQLKDGDTITTFKDDGQGIKEVESIALDKMEANLTEGDILQLTAVVTPENASNTKVDWSSSDSTVAAVDENGKVTALKAGTVTITAVSEDNKDAKAQCTITVTENNTPKPIKITNLIKDSSFKLGDDARVYIKAENNSGKDQDESLIVALYDEGAKFINYVCGKQTIKNGDSSILTGIMKLPEEGIYKLKAFVWDSLENMNPLSDIIDIPVQSNK